MNSGTMNDTVDHDPSERMAEVAQLLDQAALRAWDQAATADAQSPLHALGLGVYLARGNAAQLLSGDREVDELEDADEGEDKRSVFELLAAAEELIRPLPRLDFAYADLVVELCDLMREARALGC